MMPTFLTPSTVASLIFVTICIIILFSKMSILGQVKKLDSFTNSNSLERVSIVVPARNEEKTVAKCIDSILRQKGFFKEIIVVDDNSTDATLEAVNAFSPYGVKAVMAGEPPEGWVGKTWACHVGYLNSSGEWLLFTDADTEFFDGVVGKALNAAKQMGADIITLYPRIVFKSLLHKMTLPILLTGLYFFGKPHKIVSRGVAFAFGSFILIKRTAYERFGGHAAVKDAVLEDRAMAIRALKSGLRLVFLNATDRLVSTWNNDSRSLWNGMLRLFIPILLGRSFARTIPYILLALVCTLIPLMIFLSGNILVAAISYISASIVLGHEARIHYASFWYGFLWPLGMLAVAAALFMAFVKSFTNPSIGWRGREYLIGMGEFHEKVISVC